MVQRLFARLPELRLDRTRALVAFSGGPDSTALAVAMAEARRAGRSMPWLAHVEHRVRPEAYDLRIVLAAAERLRLPVSIRAVPDGAIAAHSGCGPEEAMRRERYLLLARLAVEIESTAVLTAHHADDQAETVLGHLIRGSGLDGAAGLRPRSTLTVPWWPSSDAPRPVEVVRPLLSERRGALRRLVDAYGLEVVADATNDDPDQTRAALRHRALPMLETIQTGAAMALARFAEVARGAVEDRPAPRVCDRGRVLEVEGFDVRPIPAQRRLLRAWVERGTARSLTFERTEAIRRWVLADGWGDLQVGGGWSIRRAGRTIMLHGDDDTRRPGAT